MPKIGVEYTFANTDYQKMQRSDDNKTYGINVNWTPSKQKKIKNITASASLNKIGIDYSNEKILEAPNTYYNTKETQQNYSAKLAFEPFKGSSIVPSYSLTTADEKRKYFGQDPISMHEFINMMEEKKRLVEMKDTLTQRSVNEGFSGGEKKKNEIFQMAMLEPQLSILDETDSGLDIDALRIVSNGINKLRTPDNSFIVITHYQRLLNYIVPDVVHVLYDGKIIKSGSKELALELEKDGYEQFIK